MSYDCTVLADSISPENIRLVTVEITFPRFILAEVNTHRVLSRNSASSRAIPTEKIIERVKTEPFIPATFNERVKGMGVGDELEPLGQQECKRLWMEARDCAVAQAEGLNHYGLDKSRVNRLLEPFMWHTAIVTATEWDNFFALRDHKAAQPEFRTLAGLMLDAMRGSTPKLLTTEEWHLPLCTDEEVYMCESGKVNWEYMAMVSAGRCARVSFDRAGELEDPLDSHTRAMKLKESGHLSPFEHPARPLQWEPPEVGQRDTGNFKGWLQLRKTVPHEENFGIFEGRPTWTA